MAEIVNELMDTRASQGYVKDYGFQFSPSQVTGLQPPDVRYGILLDMFRSDSTVSTAVGITVDAVTNNGFNFVGENQKAVKEATKLFYDNFDFDRVVDNLIYSLLIYGDAYLELRREENTITELHPLETTEMYIMYNEHGEITEFIQRPPGKPSAEIHFHPDNIIQFRLTWIGSRIYSYSPSESIAFSFSSKIYANNYLRNIFENLPPEFIHVLKGANKEQRNEYIANLRRVKSNPKEPLVVRTNGKDDDFEVKELQVKFDEGLAKALDFLKKEVLQIYRVPPAWLGMMQGDNRSTSEALIYPFELRVRKLQHNIASDINKFLLPKLGLNNIKFKFNPVAFSSEKSIVEIAQMMKTIGLEPKNESDEHPITFYLKEKGIQIPSDTKIASAEEMAEREMKVQIQDDTAPSRQRENKQTDKMTSNLNEKGVSEAGKKKLDAAKAKVS